MAKLTWNDLSEDERFGMESIHEGAKAPVADQVVQDLIVKGFVERAVGGPVLTVEGKDVVVGHYRQGGA